MTTEEIKQMISKKGAIAKDSFYTMLYIYSGDYDSFHLLSEYDEETITIICYNATIMFMETILSHKEYFEKRCKVKERNRIRIKKDLETMALLAHPDGSTNFEEEKMIIEQYPVQ